MDAAAGWYDAQRSGLGREFVVEVRAAIGSLTESPRIGSPIGEADPALGLRRIHVRRFPYQVVYLTDAQDRIVVIAVGHDRRAPAYWVDRVEPD